MPLVNCKVDLELNWYKDCLVSSANSVINVIDFIIIKTQLYVPIVTLSTKDNAKLSKQLNEGFKRSIYWNKYKTRYGERNANANFRELLDPSFQGVNRLFVLTFNNVAGAVDLVARNSYRKYFMPRVNIASYNVIIDGRHFYDQPINDLIKKYDEIRKIATGKGDNYATGCLLDYEYFKSNYQLIAVDLSKQKELDADPRAIQQIECLGNLPVSSNILMVLEQSKETTLEFYKGTAKVM